MCVPKQSFGTRGIQSSGGDDLPSTRDLTGMPDVGGLRRLSQSLAMLDAVLCPEWEYRYHSFNSKWAAGEMMASMRDGSGDDYFILFKGAGAIMKGFAHESAAWRKALELGRPLPGVLDGVPDVFASFLSEPAFSMDETTFCLWRRSTDSAWQTGAIDSLEGEDPDGSAELLRLLDGDPEGYRAWAESYFETAVARSAVDHIFTHRPLTEDVVMSLNPNLSLAALVADATEIAYPTSTG
jgi:hypothetical protein